MLLNPSLNDDDFAAAVRTAQAEYDLHQPDVIVGSSRGGAVAMNIESKDTPLVLLCPAWKNWGTVTMLKPQATILHSRKDDVISLSDSEELVAQSGLPPETLIEVGQDHRLADPEPLKAMLEACERLVHGSELVDVTVCCLEMPRSIPARRASTERGFMFFIVWDACRLDEQVRHIQQRHENQRKCQQAPSIVGGLLWTLPRTFVGR